MGGNAMAPFGARRYSKEEYLALRSRIFNTICLRLDRWQFGEILYYRNKDSFGDMDLLVNGITLNHSQSYEHFRNALNVKHFIMNGGVMSCLVDELQVDIIPTAEGDYWTSHFYYAYNDLGNLLGKIYHKFGLKFGHRGLTLPLRDGDHEFKELVVTKDPVKILEFLGLSFDRYSKGFDELEDIYRFVISSKYFAPNIYAYENLNHTNRIRDKKRSTYSGFLKYIEGMPAYKDTWEEDKSKYLHLILESFPEVKDPYYAALSQLEYKRKVALQYNGNIISAWTGFKGLTLGKFIYVLRHEMGEFETWVMQKTPEQLKEITIERAIKFDQFQRMSTLDYTSQLKPELRNA